MKRKRESFNAGIEAGGTKFACIVAAGPGDVRAEAKFPTTTSEETIGKAIAFFKDYEPFGAIGIATFGPCDLLPTSPTYGYITTTPKAGWENVNMLRLFREAFGVPIGFDTDVNAAALGEWKWGAGKGLEIVVYLTVGTGIGGGGIIRGQMIHGLVHPEMGHIRLPQQAMFRKFPGVCPYHGDCLQGLASGPAIEALWGKPAEDLPTDHPAWPLEAHFLSLAINDLICVLSPQRIILGGGVMHQAQLFPMIREEVKKLLNDYIQTPMILEKIHEYIVPPMLGDRAGVWGAIALAMKKEKSEEREGLREGKS